MSKTQVDLLTLAPITIVGGGMVGLTLALMLAKLGKQVTVIEQNRLPVHLDLDAPLPPSFDGRNTALSRKTVDTYHTLGIWDDLAPYTSPIHTIHISELGGFGKATLNATEEHVEHFGCVIENAWLGRQLLKHVMNNEQIQVLDGTHVTALTQDNDGVQLTLTQAHQEVVASTEMVVMADGKESSGRHMLGIEATVHDYEQVALVATVHTSKAHRQEAFERFTPNGPIALLPLAGDHRRSIVWTMKQGDERPFMAEDGQQRFLAALQEAFSGRAGAFTQVGAISSYPLSQVLANRQAIGRVVLMGNAAHTLHPVAGQGFNLCVRDAIVLAKHLMPWQSSQPINAVLQTYQQERLHDQQRVAQFCHWVVTGFGHPSVLAKWVRNIGLLAFDHVPFIKPMVAQYAMGLKTLSLSDIHQ